MKIIRGYKQCDRVRAKHSEQRQIHVSIRHDFVLQNIV